MAESELGLRERDEKDTVGKPFGVFVSEQSGSGKMKLHSELTWKPPVDIIEMTEEIIILVDIAGMSGKEINVVTNGKLLKINGFRGNISPPGQKQFHKLEIKVGPFERILELPTPVDHSKVTARYDHGVLKVRIPKLDSSGLEKKVPID